MSPKPPSANWLSDTGPLFVAELVEPPTPAGLAGAGTGGARGVPGVVIRGVDGKGPPGPTTAGATGGGEVAKDTAATEI